MTAAGLFLPMSKNYFFNGDGEIMIEVDLIFSPEPKFSVRGSIALWRDMKSTCEKIDNVNNATMMKKLLCTMFKELTGSDLELEGFVYVKKYDQKHGISTGIISVPWWKMIGIPILVKRFSEQKSPFSGEEKFLEDNLPIYYRKMDGVPFPSTSQE